jgi:membrane protein YqaA with SNARE-associated domain
MMMPLTASAIAVCAAVGRTYTPILLTVTFLATKARSGQSLRWLAHLGMPGVFGVAVIDSSIIPMPLPGSTDLLLLWLVSHRGNPWALLACAVSGSLLGGYFTWKIGKKGGDAALGQYVPKRLLDRTKRWAQAHPVLSVFIPAILPPPIPLSPFLLAAGALNVSLRRFMPVFTAARTLRYGVICWLAVRYGRRVVHLWSATLDTYSTPIAWMLGVLFVAGISYGVWKYRRQSRPAAQGSDLQTSTSAGT